jgi:hypothetical protein
MSPSVVCVEAQRESACVGNPWEEVLTEIKPTINPQSFRTWLGPVRFEGTKEHSLLVRVPTAEFQDWIETNWGPRIRAALAARGDELRDVVFLPRESPRPPQQQPHQQVQAASPAMPPPTPVEVERTPQQISPQAAPRRSAEGHCPTLPDAAWHSFAQRYKEIVAPTTEAPDAYHLGCFLTVVGTALCRSVCFQMGDPLYPNFYTALVGTAGEPRKGTAISRAAKLLRAIAPSSEVIRSVDSAEGFVDKLASIQGADLKEFRPVLIRLSEMRSLIEKASKEGLRNIIPKLCESYDGDCLQVNVRHNRVAVEEPFVSLLAGTSLAYLSSLKQSDIEGGLGSRLIFVPGVPKARIAEPPDLKAPTYNELVEELKGVLAHWQRPEPTRLTFSQGARERWRYFYEKQLPSWSSDDPLLQTLGVRYHHHAIKTAMVYAALDCEEEISERHLEMAIRWAEFLVASVRWIFLNFGLRPWVLEERRILEAIRNAMPLGIQRRKLQQRFWKMGAESFERRMKFLVREGGDIRQERRGRQLWLVFNEE